MKPETEPVVGEDGELNQPDTTVNQERYAHFVETHAHSDPLLFRVREHVSYYGCAYMCLGAVLLLIVLISIANNMPIFIAAMCVIAPLIQVVFMAGSDKYKRN